jgi:hypothetical protein
MRYADGCEVTEQFTGGAALTKCIFGARQFVRKIALAVRFAEVKEEAAKPTYRGKTKSNRRRGTRSKTRSWSDPPLNEKDGNIFRKH